MVMGIPSIDHIWARGYPLANGQGILPLSKEREYYFFYNVQIPALIWGFVSSSDIFPQLNRTFK